MGRNGGEFAAVNECSPLSARRAIEVTLAGLADPVTEHPKAKKSS